MTTRHPGQIWRTSSIMEGAIMIIYGIMHLSACSLTTQYMQGHSKAEPEESAASSGFFFFCFFFSWRVMIQYSAVSVHHKIGNLQIKSKTCKCMLIHSMAILLQICIHIPKIKLMKCSRVKFSLGTITPDNPLEGCCLLYL